MLTSATAFLALLLIGLLFLVVSAALGGFSDLGNHSDAPSAHADAGHADADTGSGDHSYEPSWLSPQLIAAALVGLGCFGLLATYFGLPGIVSWPLAFVGFFAVGVFMRNCVIKPLARQQHNTVITRESYVGATGTVTLKIPSDGFGQVRFCVPGSGWIYQTATANGKTLHENDPIMVTDITPDGVVVDRTEQHV